LAPRAALLTAALLLLGGCLKAPSTVAREKGCRSCHQAHYVREGACQDCHRGDPGAEREELAHGRLLTGRAAEHRLEDGLGPREGRRLVEALACRRCHTIGGKGNHLATSLDAVVWKREQAPLVTSIREPVENMPRFGLDEAEAEAIVAFLLRSGRPDPPQDTYRVHFTRGTSTSPTVFEKECGGCHLAYPPALLPSASWRGLMGGLDRHFGQNAELDEPQRARLEGWLVERAGQARPGSGGAPRRITELAWFRDEHREVPRGAAARPSVRSMANCGACHQDAARWDFDGDRVRIPR